MGNRRNDRKCPVLITCLAMVAVGLLAANATAPAQGGDSTDRTNVSIMVKDAETDKPIPNARLTLQFREEGGLARLKRPKMISYSAKTNPQGRYKFTRIPKGTIRLLVTADRHQAFGKEFEIDQDNQVIEVKLREPQPLL
jgi:hypothetical protein